MTGQLRPPAQPNGQGLACLATHGHHARLAALAGNAHRGVVQIKIGQVQSHQLAQTQTGGIKKLENGGIPLGEQIVRGQGEQPGHLVRVQGRRQPPGPLGGANTDRGISPRQALAQQIAEQAAHRR